MPCGGHHRRGRAGRKWLARGKQRGEQQTEAQGRGKHLAVGNRGRQGYDRSIWGEGNWERERTQAHLKLTSLCGAAPSTQARSSVPAREAATTGWQLPPPPPSRCASPLLCASRQPAKRASLISSSCRSAPLPSSSPLHQPPGLSHLRQPPAAATLSKIGPT